MPSVVALLGPPGSGKTTVGYELEALGLRWREWELMLLERWGSRDNLIAHKEEGLRLLHEEMREHISGPGAPAVFETTGLSDGPFLDELHRDHVLLVVRFDVSEAEAARRVVARERRRHLTDDLELSMVIWREFYEHVAARRRVDLVIDTELVSPTDAAAAVFAALEGYSGADA